MLNCIAFIPSCLYNIFVETAYLKDALHTELILKQNKQHWCDYLIITL